MIFKDIIYHYLSEDSLKFHILSPPLWLCIYPSVCLFVYLSMLGISHVARVEPWSYMAMRIKQQKNGFNGIQWNKTGMLKLSEIEPQNSLGTLK